VGWFMYLDTSYTPVAVVSLVIIYNAAFGASWGPIPWLLPPEIMPTPYRVRGVSISTATNWMMNYVVGATVPVLQETIRWRMYPMFAFFCSCSFVLVYFTYPETRGVPLEEMQTLFEDDSNDDMKQTEREPLARSRSPSPIPPAALEPPDIKNDPSSGGVLGYLFGSEIHIPETAKDGYEAISPEPEADGERV